MDITADFINRLYKLGATATDQTYRYINNLIEIRSAV